MRVLLLLLLVLPALPAHAADSEIAHRLMLYRQMYFELEFTAEPEELEYLQRKIARLERELEEYGNCPLTFDLSEVN